MISDLAEGEYEVRVRAFVDNRDADVSDLHTFADNPEADAFLAENSRSIAYGSFGDIRTVMVP